MFKKLINSLSTVKETNPVVHNITNYVTVTDVANSLLAIGASPIMSHAEKDFSELMQIIKVTNGSLVLNIGTLDDTRINQMISAGKIANDLEVPIILDPVGAGATSYRTEAALRLLKEMKITVIKGNESEIQSLVGDSNQTRGVDAVETDGNKIDLAIRAAKKYKCIVAITGKEDYISDSKAVYKVKNGTKELGKITGSGCMLAGIIGAFLCSEKPVIATTLAIGFMGLAGEMAEKNSKGPGSFRYELFDSFANIEKEFIERRLNVESIKL
ncbi:MAG: hydroxyethylthiazole kinase [Clostridia bacterium]